MRRGSVLRAIVSRPGTHVYELRYTQLLPGQYDNFYRVTMETISQRPPVGSCHGFWTVQMGALNEFVQLWEYDNLKHRYECHKLIDNDKEWQRTYVQRTLPMLYREHNLLLRMCHREVTSSTLSYKYLMYESPEQDISLSGPSAILAGSFQVIVGPNQGSYIHIVKAKDLDDLVPRSPPLNSSSKIMGPTRWSTYLGCLWR